MCFSASASFAAAAATGLVGAFAISRLSRPAQLPLAAIPLFFAAQQAVEGALWLTLPVAPESSISTALSLLFLLFAKVFWPVYAPLATLFIEPSRLRRKVLAGLCVLGAGISLFYLYELATVPHAARIHGGHIAYTAEPQLRPMIGVAYLAATGFGPLLSSYRGVQLLGLIVTAGAVVSYFFYWEAFVSVWCFFAAAGSIVILVHFVQARRVQAAA